MRITLITPLYPPDIADPAPYVKELASRLSKEHEITVLTYGNIPEKISGVSFVTVHKDAPLFVRVTSFTFKLLQLSGSSDFIVAQNGPSTELPLALVSLLSSTQSILRLGDEAALRFAQTKWLLGRIQKFAILRAEHLFIHSQELFTQAGASIQRKAVLCQRPLPRPLILPLTDPSPSFEAFNLSWDKHVELLNKIFHEHK